jgi:hypothetical protein
MQRNQAVNCLKEILECCTTLDPQAFSLMEKSRNPSSEGYSIHIKASCICKQQFDPITKKYGFEMEEENGEILIFQPKKASKTIT